MKTPYRALALAAILAGSSCAVPKPSATPAPLVEPADDQEPTLEVAGCEDEGCVEACESEPEAQWEACSEAYEAGCFSERPPPEYDCAEFGTLSETPDKTKKPEDEGPQDESSPDDDADVSSGEEDDSSPLLDRPHPD